MERDEGNHILHIGWPFLLFLVEIETEHLNYLCYQQKTFRVDDYLNLNDSLFSADTDPRNVEKMVMLPASFIRRLRWVHARQCEAISPRSSPRKARPFPNNNKPEIERNYKTSFSCTRATLLPRPQFLSVSSEFEETNEASCKGGFCKIQVYLYTIEYQKHSFPRTHILQSTIPANKIILDDINIVIRAEIPDKETDSNFHVSYDPWCLWCLQE